MRVLIVENDAATARAMEFVLKAEGFNIQTTDLGEEAVDLAKLYDYDVITLDLNLPDISGLEVLRRIRLANVKTPVLIITGDQSIETKVKTLGSGADDYMTKPANKDELVARLHALIRRSKGHVESVIRAGPITVLLDQKRVEVNGARLHLTGKEYQLMELMALRKGSTVSKDSFLNHLYGGMDEPEGKIVDVFICKLRKKLKEAGAPDPIQCVWGRGYVLADPSSEAAEAQSETGAVRPQAQGRAA
jgi:two-component system cell cycle response regulator CtrA